MGFNFLRCHWYQAKVIRQLLSFLHAFTKTKVPYNRDRHCELLAWKPRAGRLMRPKSRKQSVHVKQDDGCRWNAWGGEGYGTVSNTTPCGAPVTLQRYFPPFSHIEKDCVLDTWRASIRPIFCPYFSEVVPFSDFPSYGPQSVYDSHGTITSRCKLTAITSLMSSIGWASIDEYHSNLLPFSVI